MKGCAEVNDEVATFQPIYRSLSANDIPDDDRYHHYNHWPVLIDIPNSQRCKAQDCKKRPKFQCSKCHVYFCIASSTYFCEYHGVL